MYSITGNPRGSCLAHPGPITFRYRQSSEVPARDSTMSQKKPTICTDRRLYRLVIRTEGNQGSGSMGFWEWIALCDLAPNAHFDHPKTEFADWRFRERNTEEHIHAFINFCWQSVSKSLHRAHSMQIHSRMRKQKGWTPFLVVVDRHVCLAIHGTGGHGTHFGGNRDI